jgi:F420-dependent oxidoreductase-like protein
MAAATERVRIGCMVTGNTFRHPAVVAKAAVTVDHLSGGRLEFGLGAGWAEPEHTMLGLDFGTAGRRLDRLDEACQVVKLLWTRDRTDFAGRHYRLEGAVANPKPVQAPHPPIWIGGVGERRTLRLVAEHADVWNAAVGEPHEVGRLSRVLDRHCEEIGRDPSSIRRSVQYRFEGDADSALSLAESYASYGIDEVILVVMVGPRDSLRHAEQVARLLPRLTGL